MKQKTPMQQLIYKLKKQKQILKNSFESGKWNDDRRSEIDNSIAIAESLLLIERKAIEDAYDAGHEDEFSTNDKNKVPSQYFTETFE